MCDEMAKDNLFVGRGQSKRMRKDWNAQVYASRPSMNEFYKSPEWRKLRRECFYRDGYICQRCDKRFKSDDLTAHHIIPRIEGGSDTIENLISLCSPCHDFIEISNLRNYASIVGSYQPELKETLAPKEDTTSSAKSSKKSVSP